MNLRDLKVGDEVVMIVRDRHPERTTRAKVESVGRQLISVDGYKFRLDTGHWNNKDYSFRMQVLTLQEWSRLESEERLRNRIQKLESAIGSRSATRLSDDDITKAVAFIEHLVAKMKGNQ